MSERVFEIKLSHVNYYFTYKSKYDKIYNVRKRG